MAQYKKVFMSTRTSDEKPTDRSPRHTLFIEGDVTNGAYVGRLRVMFSSTIYVEMPDDNLKKLGFTFNDEEKTEGLVFPGIDHPDVHEFCKGEPNSSAGKMSSIKHMYRYGNHMLREFMSKEFGIDMDVFYDKETFLTLNNCYRFNRTIAKAFTDVMVIYNDYVVSNDNYALLKAMSVRRPDVMGGVFSELIAPEADSTLRQIQMLDVNDVDIELIKLFKKRKSDNAIRGMIGGKVC